MRFRISITHDRKKYNLTVEQVKFSATVEQFRVHGRNKEIVIESNRPLFRNKGLKSREPDWKIVSGELSTSSGFEVIVEAIMKYLEPVKRVL